MQKSIGDDYINALFEGTNFGEGINSSVDKKRDQIAKSIRDQLGGYWTGHTAYHILINGGFMHDDKRGTQKRLTLLGRTFMAEYEAPTPNPAPTREN